MPAYQIVQMATTNAAKALGMEGALGIIAENALADIILIDTQKPHWFPIHDPIAALVYSAKASDVSLTIINGQPVNPNPLPLMLAAQEVADATKRRF